MSEFVIVEETHRWDADFLAAAVRGLATIQAGQRERLGKQAALTYLPRGLKWLVAHPRLLRLVYVLRPAWRPTFYVGRDGDFTAFSVRGKHGIVFFEGSTARVSDPVGPTNGQTEPKTPSIDPEVGEQL